MRRSFIHSSKTSDSQSIYCHIQSDGKTIYMATMRGTDRTEQNVKPEYLDGTIERMLLNGWTEI